MNMFYRGLEVFNNLFKNINKEKKMPKGKGTYGKKKGRPSKKSGKSGKGKSYTYKKTKFKK